MSGGEINVAFEGSSAVLGDGFDYGAYPFDQFAPSAFTAVNDSNSSISASTRTVSPKDLFNDPTSLPPSTAFTNLTTPGSTYLDTPDDNYEPSPLFDTGNNTQSNDAWFSLFPDDDDAAPASLERTTSSTSYMSTSLVEGTPSQSPLVVHPGSPRKRPSSGCSPSASGVVGMHASVAGVASRKRDKPLPPIVVDPNDEKALKRARNTAAARKSRDKKVRKMEEYEAMIAELTAEKDRSKALALARDPSLSFER
ncbi:hypothetical protein LTR04_001597 [Oleoguttula sp. CCFEE 6159]|nr:hypothetical protein LTR04_001597 [Oleoguttula sp. CCFEE 6159]